MKRYHQTAGAQRTGGGGGGVDGGGGEGDGDDDDDDDDGDCLLPGVLDMSFPLSDQPRYGVWKVRVKAFVSHTHLFYKKCIRLRV